MHLVMFDIDGTLTETMKVDEECFIRSFKDVFGFADIDTDWSHYRRTTDSGIFHDVFTSRVGRSPAAQEVSRFRQHFIQLLAAVSSQSPFAPVAGADRLLSRLAQGGSHRVSLATGGWCDSARLKMASAGMCFDDHPAASADDALDRESIMRLSKQRAAERYGESFACTVYVGDGVWDARACRSVGTFRPIRVSRHRWCRKPASQVPMPASRALRPARLERATYGSGGRRSVQLNYGRDEPRR
jgi:phosphoglycolate phosphatase-like HAD superfamily hydrolase